VDTSVAERMPTSKQGEQAAVEDAGGEHGDAALGAQWQQHVERGLVEQGVAPGHEPHHPPVR
jgi:hypothetical protein